MWGCLGCLKRRARELTKTWMTNKLQTKDFQTSIFDLTSRNRSWKSLPPTCLRPRKLIFMPSAQYNYEVPRSHPVAGVVCPIIPKNGGSIAIVPSRRRYSMRRTPRETYPNPTPTRLYMVWGLRDGYICSPAFSQTPYHRWRFLDVAELGKLRQFVTSIIQCLRVREN